MLTDSGVNAMSDKQLASMMEADDSYAGSTTFTKLENKIRDLFGTEYFLPVHQGRAAENVLARVFVRPGSVVPMNYHFTTSKAHIVVNGGAVEELITDEGLEVTSANPFKGDMDIAKLEACIARHGAENIAFVRVETGTNLIGGQPHSLENMRQVSKVCDRHGVMLVLDASLLADNLYFIKTREEACKGMSVREITRADRRSGRYHLFFGPQARLRARRRHLHQKSRHFHEDARIGHPLRGLPDLWRHVGARDRGDYGRP